MPFRPLPVLSMVTPVVFYCCAAINALAAGGKESSAPQLISVQPLAVDATSCTASNVHHRHTDNNRDTPADRGDQHDWVYPIFQIYMPEDECQEQSGAQTPAVTPKKKRSSKPAKHSGRVKYKYPDPLSCHLCGYTTHYQSVLKRHLSTNHQLICKQPKSFQCDQCNYSTRWQSALDRHQRTHTEDKLFHCLQCQYATNRKDSLTRHIKTHELKSDRPKPFRCGLCNYSTNWKSQLVDHMHIHLQKEEHPRPFQCHQCRYITNCPAILKQHMNAHRSGG